MDETVSIDLAALNDQDIIERDLFGHAIPRNRISAAGLKSMEDAAGLNE